jgi:glutathione S-transferase
MSDPKYTIYYWPGVPGRGEYIRLAFEASGVPYTYVDDVGEVVKLLGTTEHTPNPHFAPPILKIEYASGKTNFLSQSTNCLAYIGSKYGLVGDREDDDEETRAFRRAKCNQYVLTAMDLGIESHDVSEYCYNISKAGTYRHLVTPPDRTLFVL